jgi:dTDP-4-amino-4,6-dideoxygalactose transaminase
VLCDARGLLLIEDCAHVIPDDKGPAEIGMLGDAVLLSFGRDKAISGIAGGGIVYRNAALNSEMQRLEAEAADLSWSTVATLIEYPAIYAIARALYAFGIGKIFLWLCAKAGFLVPILTAEEKRGIQPAILHRLPNICAALALDQLQQLRIINDHRRAVTQIYLQAAADHGWPVLHGIGSHLPLQKYPLFLAHAEEIRLALKRQNIHLHDGWTGCTVCPATVPPEHCGYTMGNSPMAESLCEQILTLPTHPGTSAEDAHRVIRALHEILSHNI